MINSVCSNCGRSIFREFIFCPWCGKETVHADEREDVLLSKNLLKKKKIESFENKIEKLEQELNVLVLSNEMHRL